ncbi:MAG: hypothetical protein ACOYJE_02845 [Bacteroidaceae bacterium]|jgi:hypothetical protein
MDKKKTQRLALLAMTAISFPLSTVAQDKLEANVGADIVSQYIWRGQSLGNASIQPAASIAYKGLSLSGWGSVEFSKENAREFDLTLGYSLKGFSVSVTDYWFDQGAGYFHYGARNTQHVFEAQIGYDFGFLALNWYTNFAGNDGIKKNGDRAYSSYFEISAPFKLGGLDWTAEIGAVPWETSFYNFIEGERNGARGFEVSNVALGVSKEIKITNTFSLPLFGKAIWNPATEGAYFVVGLSL